ncbi:divisome protein SepX/GlpR [Mycobacterium shigaense]|uniref:divisome protein SepX/GlpR n=1 Tax=Mycobacterium shigaense TaxID=722731 RepID=UPI000E597D0B|nr:gephyrin-like molybdotransferase receptor GlpR [Mycobacterium shigaense]MEA1120729.1 gephyrin-like molybdotransferase receptor GlpR [Mycobacterium shigaense]
MPSIPQSLLWISLVVLWLFVLVPMLISKRDAVRRTSDVALASRVLNGGANARLLKRTGPASGHRSDPDWRPEEDSADDELDEAQDDSEDDVDHEPDTVEQPAHAVVMRIAVAETTEPDYLDVDVVEDSAALPAGVSGVVPEPVMDEVDEAAEDEHDGADEDADLADRYEYVEDSSGLEPEAEQDDDVNTNAFVAARSRRRRFDTTHAAAIDAKKYAARKRVLMVLAVILVGTATAAFEISPSAWWACGGATFVTLIYLGYLRRQTRIEEKIRRRRAQRMARARLGVENARDRQYDVVPSRLRRPGAVVLEIDDEDPIFEHLDYAMPQQHFGWSRELPRAVGQ